MSIISTIICFVVVFFAGCIIGLVLFCLMISLKEMMTDQLRHVRTAERMPNSRPADLPKGNYKEKR